MVKWNRKKLIIAACAASFVLCAVLVGRDRIAVALSNDDKPHVQSAVLERELLSVPLHPGDKASGAVKTFDKAIIVGATMHVTSEAPASAVMAYYTEALPKLGWIPVPGKQRVDELKFCRSGLSLVVQISPSDVSILYYLGVVWTQYKGSESYCAI